MANKPLRPCNSQGCPNLTRERYCENHKLKAQGDNSERHRYYDKYRRDQKSSAFYKSTEWARARQQALIRDNGLCQHCLKENRLTSAAMVHHIIEVREDWSKRLVIDNLMSLCQPCHNRVHHKK